MNDDQKTKEQLLEELAQVRVLLERERERSLSLQEVSKKVAAAHDTEQILDLIVNDPAYLAGSFFYIWLSHRSIRHIALLNRVILPATF